MCERYLGQAGFTYSTCEPFLKKTKNEYKNLKKQENQEIFIKTN